MLLTAYYSFLFQLIIFQKNVKDGFINSDFWEKTIYKDSLLLFLCSQMILILKI